MINVYRGTDIGRQRSLNQDSLLVIEDLDSYVVADGMGGHAAGEVASRIFVDTAAYEMPRAIKLDEEGLRWVTLQGNRAILRHTDDHPEEKGMGTTVTMLHFEDGIAYYAHVGDSRLYRLRDGRLEQITKDHSYVAKLVEQGTITPEEAKTHPRRNVLMRAVGIDFYVEVDTGQFPLQNGDRFLLCSDGLSNMVDEFLIKEVLEHNYANDKARDLIDLANQAGGKDNITAIVVEYN